MRYYNRIRFSIFDAMGKKINLRDQVRNYLLKEMTTGTLDLRKNDKLGRVIQGLRCQRYPNYERP